MSNETTQKRSLSVSLGAAFLMATSAIGPGFLTQTSQFTAKYLSSFAFVIVCVIIMDMIAQTNVWSIVGVSGLRGQEIANKVLPGLGYLLVVLVVLGGLAFNIGNVGGVSLGFNAMIGIPEKAGVIIGGVLAICIFLSKKGTFYLFPGVEKTGLDEKAFCKVLLDQAHVLVSPGTPFGVSAAGHFRIACTVGIDQLKTAFDRMEKLSF